MGFPSSIFLNTLVQGINWSRETLCGVHRDWELYHRFAVDCTKRCCLVAFIRDGGKRFDLL